MTLLPAEPSAQKKKIGRIFNHNGLFNKEIRSKGMYNLIVCPKTISSLKRLFRRERLWRRNVLCKGYI